MLLTISMVGFTAGIASAENAEKHMQILKDSFAEEFDVIDSDKDGKISKEEYISYQFDNVRLSLLGDESDRAVAEALTEVKPEIKAEVKPQKQESKKSETPKDEIKSLSDVSKTLQAMADFDVENDLQIDDKWLDESMEASEPMAEVAKIIAADEAKTQKKDSAPVKTAPKSEPSTVTAPQPQKTVKVNTSVEEPKIEVSPELVNIIKDMETPDKTVAPKADEPQDAVIEKTIDVLKKSLPKKIDEVTTWSDIEYKNKAITYIYSADFDTVSYSAKDKEELKKNITNEACANAYKQLCPKMKVMFMDEGIKVAIRYLDKSAQEIGTCEFNNETCK